MTTDAPCRGTALTGSSHIPETASSVDTERTIIGAEQFVYENTVRMVVRRLRSSRQSQIDFMVGFLLEGGGRLVELTGMVFADGMSELGGTEHSSCPFQHAGDRPIRVQTCDDESAENISTARVRK